MTAKTPLAALAAVTLALSGALAAGADAQTAPASPVGADADSTAASTTISGPTGADVYANVCAACHMPDAMGAVGAGFYPALANNPRLLGSRYPAYIVVKGMNGMPPMADMLDDQQIADVVNYVRTNFGNDYPGPISPTEIAALR
ncbi:cytochrome c [Altererythrobacter sp. KTW20L]|uniref:c-type cytochrome n=1 Tax=Altererythrobacter sp. KTW20L TaxID=2942210 RepID=UPI0020BD4E7E|nr:cytochrome c [Altererythrobacter sp. KTW20L]MCL6251587.1 cytochrome c [Altererythrobacter sp. KTW20L]